MDCKVSGVGINCLKKELVDYLVEGHLTACQEAKNLASLVYFIAIVSHVVKYSMIEHL
jgi:hypothetical protein